MSAMVEHLKITIETDASPEPFVIEHDVVSWRYSVGTDTLGVSRGGDKEYEIIGGSIDISWRLAHEPRA